MPTSYPSNVKPVEMDLSPCIVKFRKPGETEYTDLGGTLGDAKVKWQYPKADIKADQFGTTVLDRRVTGYMATVETELTQVRNFDQLKILFPHAVRNTTWTTQAVTISNASPGVVTVLSSSIFSVGQEINFSTTGALPAPLISGQIYYVSLIASATTIQISETPGGTSLGTTSAGSGVHTARYSPTLDAISFITNVGDGDLAVAGELLLHPQSVGLNDERFDMVFFKATASAESEYTFSPTAQSKLKIVWNIYPDFSVSPARFARYGKA